MTYAAKNALRECLSAAISIDQHIDELTEPGLKAFIHDASERTTEGSVVERAIWTGIAQAGEARLKVLQARKRKGGTRSEEHTSELQSLMRISYAVFCLKKKKRRKQRNNEQCEEDIPNIKI